MTAQDNAPKPISCRPSQAKILFGVSQSTIYEWAQKGHITIYRRAGSPFLKVAEVESFIFGLGGQMGGSDPHE